MTQLSQGQTPKAMRQAEGARDLMSRDGPPGVLLIRQGLRYTYYKKFIRQSASETADSNYKTNYQGMTELALLYQGFLMFSVICRCVRVCIRLLL